MSDLYPIMAGDILARFNALKDERQLRFVPPTGSEQLGDFAFPSDVINTVLIGVATGVLKDLLLQAVQAVVKTLRADDATPDALIAKMRKDSEVLRDGVAKLKAQGLKTDDAETAIDLLVEAVRASLADRSTRAE